jgi:hypothetical protein
MTVENNSFCHPAKLGMECDSISKRILTLIIIQICTEKTRMTRHQTGEFSCYVMIGSLSGMMHVDVSEVLNATIGRQSVAAPVSAFDAIPVGLHPAHNKSTMCTCTPELAIFFTNMQYRLTETGGCRLQ